MAQAHPPTLWMNEGHRDELRASEWRFISVGAIRRRCDHPLRRKAQKVLFWDSGAEAIYGYSEEEMWGSDRDIMQE